jgi:CheY-like chemotaxis protein
MLRRLLGAHIELVTNMERALGSIKADRAQIEQILMNLAVNARDAMPHGGKLTIETKHVTHEGINGTVGVIPAGAYVLLAVTDTGTGMDEQILQNVFEPFFTTKEQGKGTGLGLSTVYGIVKQSQGFIHVDSAPGKGSSFEIYFPRVDAPADRPALRSLSKIADGTETVLLVEDEDLVRKAAARILERHGYHVIIAAHGEDALRKAEQYQGTIDLLLTDVAMPGMSGTTLAERLAPKHPEMRVAYMSGYTEDPLVHADNDLAYVRKPFTPDRLLRKIRGVLDRAKRADR